MPKFHTVSLDEAERLLLETTVRSGTASARTITKARILLKADDGDFGPGWTDTVIADALDVGLGNGLPPRASRQRSLIGQALNAAANLMARPKHGLLPCGVPLLRMVESAGRSTCWPRASQPKRRCRSRTNWSDRRSKNELRPHLKQQWCIPPEQNAEFCWRMEDILAVYTRPHDPRVPLICFDETPKQLLAHSRAPLPARSDHPLREDYEYVRQGTANLFLWYEPLTSRRHVEVTERRTRTDWAHAIKDLVDDHYPDAERIVLVLDNLNTHTSASLYPAFPAAEAKRLPDKLEIHYTPKHGSWLDMAGATRGRTV